MDFGPLCDWNPVIRMTTIRRDREERGYIKGLYCPILTFFCCIGKGITWEHKDNIKHMLSLLTYRVFHMDGPKTKVHICCFYLFKIIHFWAWIPEFKWQDSMSKNMVIAMFYFFTNPWGNPCMNIFHFAFVLAKKINWIGNSFSRSDLLYVCVEKRRACVYEVILSICIYSQVCCLGGKSSRNAV